MNAARAKLDSVDLWADVVRSDKFWKVRMPDGVTRAMSVDELDRAFDEGRIGLRSLVQRPSGGEWLSLAEAANVGDSIRPVTADYDLIDEDIPAPSPLPESMVIRRRIVTPPPLPAWARAQGGQAANDARAQSTPPPPASSSPLTVEELRVAGVAHTGPSRTGRRLAAVAVLGLLAGGIFAWRYMPAQPITALATTTIMAPQATALAAAPLTPAPALPPLPETTPAPEGNAVPSLEPTTVTAAKPAKPAAKKKLTWKERGKLHATVKAKL